uniref:SFRICE_016195 n=1 Tax=Spodoptera frugiperda TaxID=7108 RepID=A0A2H1V040_SPOFR
MPLAFKSHQTKALYISYYYTKLNSITKQQIFISTLAYSSKIPTSLPIARAGTSLLTAGHVQKRVRVIFLITISFIRTYDGIFTMFINFDECPIFRHCCKRHDHGLTDRSRYNSLNYTTRLKGCWRKDAYLGGTSNPLRLSTTSNFIDK